MTYLYCRTQTRIPTQIQTLNQMVTLYCTETSSDSDLDLGTRLLLYAFMDGYPYPDPCPEMYKGHY